MAKYISKKSPQEILNLVFNRINRVYFNDSIVAEAVLEVPPRPVVVSVENSSRKVEKGSEVEESIEKGIMMALKGDVEGAKSILEPLAQVRYREAIEALLHIERNNHGDYTQWAAMLNSMDKKIERYPAACLDKDIAKIFIHPLIGDPNCPRFVMGYLVHHECLHLESPSVEGDPHHPEFMERDRAFPKRNLALSWLRKNEFPVVDI